MRASYAFVLQKNNAEVSTYSVLTPTFIIEPIIEPKRTASNTIVLDAKKNSLVRPHICERARKTQWSRPFQSRSLTQSRTKIIQDIPYILYA